MKKIVILGAGYAGLKTVVDLQNKINKNEYEITIVNKNDYHYESTWLHEVSVGTVKPEKASFDIKSLLSKHVKFINDTVLKVDTDNKKVELSNSSLDYDYLVFALGFESDDFNIPGVKEYTYPITTRNSAIKIKEKLLFELKNMQTDLEKILTINVIGAGFSGIELLGEFKDILPKYCKEFNIDINRIKINNIHPGDEIIPMFDKKLINHATKALEKFGVNFMHKHFMVGAKENSIEILYNEEKFELESDLTIWTAGVKGNKVITESNFVNRKDRVAVDEFLRPEGFDNIFIIGDSAAVKGKDGNFLPTTAQLAIQNGQSVAKNLVRISKNKELKKFKYSYKGTVCSLGEFNAVGTAFGINVRGIIASYLKKAIDDRSLLMLGGLKTLFKKGKI